MNFPKSPFRRDLKSSATVVVTVALTALCGCSKPPVPDRLAVYPVSGQATWNGKPIEGATINLHPLFDTGASKLVPTSVVQADGSFKIQTFATDDGAPEGDYQVSIVWWDGPGGSDDRPQIDRLRGRYAAPAASGLKVHVSAEPTTLTPFVLK